MENEIYAEAIKRVPASEKSVQMVDGKLGDVMSLAGLKIFTDAVAEIDPTRATKAKALYASMVLNVKAQRVHAASN
jgi:hypothetical protein